MTHSIRNVFTDRVNKPINRFTIRIISTFHVRISYQHNITYLNYHHRCYYHLKGQRVRAAWRNNSLCSAIRSITQKQKFYRIFLHRTAIAAERTRSGWYY